MVLLEFHGGPPLGTYFELNVLASVLEDEQDIWRRWWPALGSLEADGAGFGFQRGDGRGTADGQPKLLHRMRYSWRSTSALEARGRLTMNIKDDLGCLAISILVIVVGLLTVAGILVAFHYVYGGPLWNFH
jgi:hypothetical protein